MRNLAWIGVPAALAILAGMGLRLFVPSWIIHLALLAASASLIVRGSWIMWKGRRPPETRRKIKVKLPAGAGYIVVGVALIAYFIATFWR